MTEQAKVSNEETSFRVADEQAKASEQGAGRAAGKESQGPKASEKRGFRIPGLEAGREVAQQLIRPWFDATSTTLNHAFELQQRLMGKTQEAMQGTFDLLNEGVEQYFKVTQRTHNAVQEQIKRFGSR